MQWEQQGKREIRTSHPQPFSWNDLSPSRKGGADDTSHPMIYYYYFNEEDNDTWNSLDLIAEPTNLKVFPKHPSIFRLLGY